MTFGGSNAVFLKRGLLLAGLDGGDAAFHRAHAVEVFVELLLIYLGQGAAQVAGAA